MFERFTERAREVVVLAQDEARTLKHNYIGTEHILLGLLREEDGLAARVLDTFDVTLEEVRAQVTRIVGPGSEDVGGQVPFTPGTKKVLELALREALSLGHNYIGTEHILLGLVRENEGVGARILQDFDADTKKIRDELLRMLSGPSRPGRAPTGKSEFFISAEGGEAGAKARYEETHRLRLVVACPNCAVPIEVVVTDQRNAHFQVSMRGNHTCPGCGRKWAITATAAWTDPSPPVDPADDLLSGMTVWRYPDPAQFSMFCFRCEHALERVSLDQPGIPGVHVEADGDRTCPGCGKAWIISYAVSWEARTE